MTSGRPFSEICRELADSAKSQGDDFLGQLLAMAALHAAETGLRHHDSRVQDLIVGVWDWDVVNDCVYADARFAALFGISAEEAAKGAPLKTWLSAVHPDDVDDLSKGIERALEGKLFSMEYRVITKRGVRWLYARGKCTFNRQGRPVRFPGAVVDITHEKTDELSFSIAPQ